MKIFDSHIHVQPWEEIKPSARAMLGNKVADRKRLEVMMRDPDRLVEHMDREGVERACIINYVAPEVMGFTDRANAHSGRFGRAYPDRIIAYGSVNPRHSRDAAGDVRRLVEEHGIRGLKIHPPHQLFRPNAYRDGMTALEAIYATAQKLRLPVMVHTGTSIFPGARNAYADPIHLDDVGIDFPELTVILAHGGRPLWMRTAVFLLRRFPNFWMDISSIPPKRLLEYFPGLERISDRVLFGSDWPAPGVPGMRKNAELVASLPLSEEAKRKILYDNAARLYAGPA